MTSTFRDKLGGSLGATLEAIALGLERTHTYEDFRVDMAWFYQTKGDICLGCLATTTILYIENLRPSTTRFSKGHLGAVEGTDRRDFLRFEGAIDSLRLGYTKRLFDYLGIEEGCVPKEVLLSISKFNINNLNWRDYIPVLKDLAKKCKDAEEQRNVKGVRYIPIN